jgi:ABC-type transport system involved in multi-copper enzyme maturation permease subunit
MTLILRQTGALFLDAYRELNARKLFWVVLALSAICVLAFAAVGINENGLVLLWWQLPVPMVSQLFPSKALFYKFLFFELGFKFWLTWAATILALISTASLIPDFVAGGSVDMLLAKPVSRARLFVTKYLTGLLFAALQVTVFSVAAFLVIGLRGGEWILSLFLAIPLVVLFFSYLFAVSALVGLLTRSTIAALIGVMVFWFVIFIANATESGLLSERIKYDQAVLILSSDREMQRAELEAGQGGEPEVPAETSNRRRPRRPATPESLAQLEANLEAAEQDRRFWARWHAWAFAVKSVLPKTGETMGILGRKLISAGELDAFTQNVEQQAALGPDVQVHGVRLSQRTLQRELQNELRARGAWWIIGTSLGFELAVLAGAVWVFARRDF